MVLAGLGCGYAVGRALGLNPRLATLIACGNAICGNSAIAAVAPVIGAEREDVASSIAFTAVLGVVVVLGLPLLGRCWATHYQYGVLAGMTVYAVPQVLAATFPVSALSGEVGTLVKLVRVLLLGPVVVFFSFRAPRIGAQELNRGQLRPLVHRRLPACWPRRARSALIPASARRPVREVSRWLTVAAMAALGLGVDVRALRQVGGG